MFIHQTSCISPQQSFGDIDLRQLNPSVENKLKVIEPKYNGVPVNLLRRMGKAVRIGTGVALPLVEQRLDIKGIIMGTANGGMEDCIKFLNQIIEYEEGALTPTNFVQSTPNAISAQIGLLSANFDYNITHSHRGLSFENALLDARMMLMENPDHQYLVGGVDEISTYNFNIDFLAGWYKKETVANDSLYESQTSGSIAGEGAAIYLVNNKADNAIAKVEKILTSHTEDKAEVARIAEIIFKEHNPELLIMGENGDVRMSSYYHSVENIIPKEVPIVRYKHMSGEYPTTTSFALWLAVQKLNELDFPPHMFKKGQDQPAKKILIYNTYKGKQHGFILVSR